MPNCDMSFQLFLSQRFFFYIFALLSNCTQVCSMNEDGFIIFFCIHMYYKIIVVCSLGNPGFCVFFFFYSIHFFPVKIVYRLSVPLSFPTHSSVLEYSDNFHSLSLPRTRVLLFHLHFLFSSVRAHSSCRVFPHFNEMLSLIFK